MNSQDSQNLDIAEEAEVTPAPSTAEAPPPVAVVSPLSSGVGRRGKVAPAGPVAPTPSVRPRSASIGRGGVSAIVMLVVFIPLLGILIFLLFDANYKVANLQNTLQSFQANANSPAQAQFAVLASQPDLQILPFQSEDGTPIGRFVLYNGGGHDWAITYGQLDPLDPGQAYGVWLVNKQGDAKGLVYTGLVVLPDVRTGGNVRMLQQTDFPTNFHVENYSQLVVTVETVTQLDKQPHGPRRFVLNLSQVK